MNSLRKVKVVARAVYTCDPERVGYFHGFYQDLAELVAIIELEDGSVTTVPPHKIIFIRDFEKSLEAELIHKVRAISHFNNDEQWESCMLAVFIPQVIAGLKEINTKYMELYP